VTRPAYLSGVIEGFYGRPWRHDQRLALFARLAAWGFTSYVYAPKDDIKLRARWRDPYDDGELAALGELVAGCAAHGLRFGYAVAPCLDVRYAEDGEAERLLAKVDQLVDLGARDVLLLFDDVPHRLDDASRARFGGLAQAQAHLSERLFDHLRSRVPDGRRIVCPTDYCRRMADASGDASGDAWGYLRTLGERLAPDVDVCWTGDEIVSERIDAASLADVTATLGRKPLIWDNLHANDYDLRRLYLGPLAGRSADLVDATAGFLTNPNTPFEVNEVALATLATYLSDPAGYDPARAWERALEAWRPAFAVAGGDALTEAELRLLAELCHLPWSSGPRVEAVLDDARAVLEAPPDPADPRLRGVRALADEVEGLLERLTELVDRDLLYALYGVVWEARTESRALADSLEHRARDGSQQRFGRPHQLANTYRRGFAADVQALLPLDRDGHVAVPTTEDAR